ncbi:hypothetical protein E4K72_18215 [Oxalobacteraceae bacterium OM1]|nr:hypothetical protein E4K72_18215 [Oxalobacteraceae bacterium OM1]
MQTLLALAFADAYAELRLRIACVFFSAILVIGNLPGARDSLDPVASGVTLHSCAYSFIAYLIYFGTVGTWGRRVATTIFAVALLGALDEGVQAIVPWREAALMDWMVDVLAATVTSAVLSVATALARSRAVSG